MKYFFGSSILKTRSHFKLVFVLGLLLSTNLVSAHRPDSTLYHFFSSLYHFDFSKAEKLIEKNSNHPIEQGFIKVNMAWWQIISGNDNETRRTQFNQGILQMKNATAKCGSTVNPDTLFMLINLNAMSARLDFLDKNYIQGLSHLNSCMELLKRSFGHEKDHPNFLLTSGLYNYFMARAWRSQPYLIPYLTLFPRGDFEKGLQQLHAAANSRDIVISTEANYFLSKIFLESESEPTKARKYTSLLITRFPSNLLFRQLHFLTYLNAGEENEAVRELALMKLQCINREEQSGTCEYYARRTENLLSDFYLKRNSKK